MGVGTWGEHFRVQNPHIPIFVFLRQILSNTILHIHRRFLGDSSVSSSPLFPFHFFFLTSLNSPAFTHLQVGPTSLENNVWILRFFIFFQLREWFLSFVSNRSLPPIDLLHDDDQRNLMVLKILTFIINVRLSILLVGEKKLLELVPRDFL